MVHGRRFHFLLYTLMLKSIEGRDFIVSPMILNQSLYSAELDSILDMEGGEV